MRRISELLQKILEKTKNGMEWEKYDFDAYRANTIAGEIRIVFLFPMLGDETTSGADIAKVSVNNLEIRFYEGSEDMEVVRQILRAGNAEWREHQEANERKINAALKMLDG